MPYFAYQLRTKSGGWAFHDDPPDYDNGDTYTYITCKNADGEKDDGYIDHTEDLGYFIESTVFNEKRLLNYLFDYNSYVSTGNDNSDEAVEAPDLGPSWDFDKDN